MDPIESYHAEFPKAEQRICAALRGRIDDALPEAEAKIWHAHPVWFLQGNPVVGYGRLKDCIRLLFWSGQSFQTPGLSASGRFKAAELRLTAAEQIEEVPLRAWLEEARAVQWDYKNIVRRKGRLERLR